MKTKVKLLFLIFLLFGLGCSKEIFEQTVGEKSYPQPFNQNHSRGVLLQKIIDEYCNKGIPGVSVALADDEGLWEGAAGFAKIESGMPLKNGIVHAAGSVTKIYTATAILKLYELNEIKLDEPIEHYLPKEISHRIANPGKITVRMLLSHKSGIPDYIEDNDFKLHWFNDLSQRWTIEDIFSSLKTEKYLEPGKQFRYSNTNYVLLSLMIEWVTKRRETAWMKENMLEPLGLKHTFYREGEDFLNELAMPNYYLDRFGDGRLQNVTVPTKVEIYSEYGDGGLVATSIDFVKFMQALTSGKILNETTFELMKTPTENAEYGLGLDIFSYQQAHPYGHQGAVFGGSSLLLHFEARNTNLFIAANCDATLVGGKTLQLYHEMKNKICDLLAAP